MGIAVLAATWAGGIWFRSLAVIIMLVVHYEFSTMANAPARSPLANAIGWLAVMATALFRVDIAAVDGAGGNLQSARPERVFAGVTRGGGLWSATAVLYAGLAGLALAEIRGDGLSGLFAMLFIYAIVWTADTLALFLRPRAWRPETGAAHIAWQDLVGRGLRWRLRASARAFGTALAFRHGGGGDDPSGGARAGDCVDQSATCSNPG